MTVRGARQMEFNFKSRYVPFPPWLAAATHVLKQRILERSTHWTGRRQRWFDRRVEHMTVVVTSGDVRAILDGRTIVAIPFTELPVQPPVEDL